MTDVVGPAPETMETLGAGELIPGAEGLDITALDGALAHAGAVVGNSYENVARSFTTNLNLSPRPLVIVANEAALAALSDEHQAALGGAADRVFPIVMNTVRQEDQLPETQRADLCSARLELIELSQAELGTLEDAVRPVRDRLAKQGGEAHLAEIDTLKQQVGAPPNVFRCS